ncbi:hypothetical protein TNCV_4861631 [Trichonephila clavipes]|nr:hypothetical protein TNCV_4861631 [Trichonephila clavipes]
MLDFRPWTPHPLSTLKNSCGRYCQSPIRNTDEIKIELQLPQNGDPSILHRTCLPTNARHELRLPPNITNSNETIQDVTS